MSGTSTAPMKSGLPTRSQSSHFICKRGASNVDGTSSRKTSRQQGSRDFFFVEEVKGSSTPSIHMTIRGSEEPPFENMDRSIMGNPRPRPTPITSSLGHLVKSSFKFKKGRNTRASTWRHLKTSSISPLTTPFVLVSFVSSYQPRERPCFKEARGISHTPMDCGFERVPS